MKLGTQMDYLKLNKYNKKKLIWKHISTFYSRLIRRGTVNVRRSHFVVVASVSM